MNIFSEPCKICGQDVTDTVYGWVHVEGGLTHPAEPSKAKNTRRRKPVVDVQSLFRRLTDGQVSG